LAPELRIGAALFNGNHARLGEEVERLEAAGVDLLHLDVFDGRLVRGLAFAPRTIAALRSRTALPFEVHLAAERPELLLSELAEAGAGVVLVHAEGAPMLYETLFAIREQGMRAGVAVGLATTLATVEAALPFVDAVLLLSRVTGEGTRGAAFDRRVLPRLERVRELVDAAGADVDLQVAGGVDRTVVAELVGRGADTVAVGGALYSASDMQAGVRELREAAAGVPS
jgi:ribulose-phosphate 3-epimerase